ncbi:Anion exchange protein [Plakobranchus ocellatus]|uniref:Anion exchange protein n=1 Tax=Plakobranchus ocellatus TaxID=259542 RepID=A0AAV4CMG1_9GAST|nr:Anion exchange protein [Plakobranchus ocellatus]
MTSPVSSADPSRVDPGMPVRDHGSFASFHVPSQADISDHRKQDTVYIGLHMPRQERRRRRGHRGHRHRTHDSSRSGPPQTNEFNMEGKQTMRELETLYGDMSCVEEAMSWE